MIPTKLTLRNFMCYRDQVAYILPDVHGQTRIPPSPLLSGAP